MTIFIDIDIDKLRNALGIECICAYHDYDYIVINDSGIYRVKSGRSGQELSSYSTPEEAIQYALDNAISDIFNTGLSSRILFLGSFTIQNPVSITQSPTPPARYPNYLILDGGVFNLLSTFLNINATNVLMLMRNVYVKIGADGASLISAVNKDDGYSSITLSAFKDITIDLQGKVTTAIDIKNDGYLYFENIRLEHIVDGAIGVKLTTDITTGSGQSMFNKVFIHRTGLGQAIHLEGINSGFRQHDILIGLLGADDADVYDSGINGSPTDDQFGIYLKATHKAHIELQAELGSGIYSDGDYVSVWLGQPVRVRNYGKMDIYGVKPAYVEALGGLTRILTDADKIDVNGGDVILLGDVTTLNKISGNVYQIQKVAI